MKLFHKQKRRDELSEELDLINKKSFAMALSIQKDPILRNQLSQEARLLTERLLHTAKELERFDPSLYKLWFHRISESLLDLKFVEGDSGTTSIRLGDIIKWG